MAAQLPSGGDPRCLVWARTGGGETWTCLSATTAGKLVDLNLAASASGASRSKADDNSSWLPLIIVLCVFGTAVLLTGAWAWNESKNTRRLMRRTPDDARGAGATR